MADIMSGWIDQVDADGKVYYKQCATCGRIEYGKDHFVHTEEFKKYLDNCLGRVGNPSLDSNISPSASTAQADAPGPSSH